MVLEGDEEGDVENADADEYDGVGQSRNPRSTKGTVANEITETGCGGDAYRERDVVHEHADRHQHRLCCKVYVGEICSAEREDIECEPFAKGHHDARCGETHHWQPISEGGSGETWPALEVRRGDEADVGD